MSTFEKNSKQGLQHAPLWAYKGDNRNIKTLKAHTILTGTKETK